MQDWFTRQTVAPGVTLVTEPFISDFYRANLYTVAGTHAHLQFDFGCGIQPLRPALTRNVPTINLPVIAVASHAHIDHVGGLHEFDTRLGHAAEAEGFATMAQRFTLKQGFAANRYGPSLTRQPGPNFRLQDWDLVAAPLTGTLAEGDRVDLGNRVFTVLHLPGHSPGGIGLLDEANGLFLSGDAIYDDTLLDDLPGSSVPDYLATMTRLVDLDCHLVLGGHGAPFGKARLKQLALAYISAKD